MAKQPNVNKRSKAATLERLSLADVKEDFFGPPVLARILGVNEGRGYELARSEGFPSRRIGRKILISRSGFTVWERQNFGVQK